MKKTMETAILGLGSIIAGGSETLSKRVRGVPWGYI